LRYFPVIIFSAFFCLFQIQLLYSQVSSAAADAEKFISYKTYTGNDKVFIFYSSPGSDREGSLRVDAPGPGVFDFSWSAFDTLTLDWGSVFKTETGVAFSTAGGLEEGGYRIDVSNGTDVDTSYYSWIFIDNLLVDVEETPDGRIKTSKISCDLLTLNGAVEVDRFSYYDPVNFEKIELINGASFLWTSDNPDLIIPNASRILNPNTTYRPPVVDTWYILTAVDSFGMEDVDSVFYETIHVEAEFTYEFFDKEDTNEYVEAPTPPHSDAPLKVRFTNASTNGYKFEWIFGDSASMNNPEDKIATEDINFQPEYTYKIPDEYYPVLVAESLNPYSEKGCVDTFRLEEPLIVIPSELEAPNVFSPEGLEQNRYFKVKFKSIKEFHIRIYSRTGNLVYKQDITDLYSWDGWDGNILNSNRPAPPGAYYYIIEATGYDEVRYNKGPYKGVVYLFRGKN